MLRRAVSDAYVGSLGPGARRFAAAVHEPAAAQRARLHAILRATAGSAYGREAGVAADASPRAFQDAVAMTDAQRLAPYLRRIAAGEGNVLSASPVRWLERTGGTSGEPKLMPCTEASLAEVRAAVDPWIHDLHVRDPGLRGLRSYWSVSPAGQALARTPAGIRIGAPDDTEYLGPATRWAARRLLAVPPDVAADGMEAWRGRTLRHLVNAEDLGLISVWSPTFLTLLMEAMEERLPDILRDARPGRRRRIEARLGKMPLTEALWPRLRLVSCWTDGPSASLGFVAGLRRHFPGTPVQGKGLLATEGVVSVPFGAAAPVLAVNSHFLEFADAEHPDARPKLAHELEEGRTYAVLLTTGAGLLRYRLRDLVQCVGRLHATPTIRFLRREDAVSDLCGEKLQEAHAAEAIGEAFAAAGPPPFAMLGPELGPARYCLFVEGISRTAAERAAAEIDAALCTSHPYRYCRELGQLAPVQAVVVERGLSQYMDGRVAKGARLGDVKPAALDPRTGWKAILEAAH